MSWENAADPMAVLRLHPQNRHCASDHFFGLPRKLWAGLSSTTRILRAPAGMTAASM